MPRDGTTRRIRTNVDDSAPSDDDDPPLDEANELTARSRMVDWIQSSYLPFAGLSVGLVSALFSTVFKYPSLAGLCLLASILAFPVVLCVNLVGYVFDPCRDRLSYPLYFMRRRLSLSELSDANCQSYSKRLRTSGVDGSSASRTIRRYAVNLSGSFGARRIVFFSKYKRDQFLSLIRHFAPHVRITRWS
jgi:hypothetical protein